MNENEKKELDKENEMWECSECGHEMSKKEWEGLDWQCPFCDED